MAVESVIIIEELTGASPARLELRGGGLPRKGAAWETQLRADTTWYDGYNIATQQVLGTMEAPTEFEGMWRTTILVRTPCTYTGPSSAAGSNVSGTQVVISRANELRDTFRGFLKRGQALRVTWAEGDRRLVRVGLLTTFKTPHDRMDDIGWHATFTWSSDGDTPPAPEFRNERMDILVASAIQAAQRLSESIATDAIAANAARQLGTASTFTLGDLESLANAPTEFVEQFTRTADNLVNSLGKVVDLAALSAQQIPNVITDVVDVATNATNTLNNACDVIGRQVPESYSNVDESVSRLLTVANYYDTAVTLADVLAEASYDAARRLKQRKNALAAKESNDKALGSDILTVILPKVDDTFASISQTYYQTIDFAEQIAISNGYAGYEVSPQVGQPLVLFRRTGTSSTTQVYT